MSAIRPMLASDFPTRLSFPLIAQPKYDGVRALTREGRFQSRSGKPFANKKLPFLAEILPSGLDGELIVAPGYGEGTCRKTCSVVNSHDGPIGDLIYILYDLHDTLLPYEERLAKLHGICSGLPSYCAITESLLIQSHSALDSYEQLCLSKGYEGLILRQPRARYKHGRCTETDFRLAKLKRFSTDEALCIGVEEQMENLNPSEFSPLGFTERSSAASGKVGKQILGAFICDWRGHTLRIGTGEGLTLSERRRLFENPPIGKLLTFKYQPHGMKSLPRSPIFISIREDL